MSNVSVFISLLRGLIGTTWLVRAVRVCGCAVHDVVKFCRILGVRGFWLLGCLASSRHARVLSEAFWVQGVGVGGIQAVGGLRIVSSSG